MHGNSSYFVWINRSKESLTLDLKDPRGRAILHGLLRDADVFVQNLAPGAADRLGLGTGELTRRHPRLIPCTISGTARAAPGPAARRTTCWCSARTGLVSLTGTPEGPARTGISVADIAAGMYAYSGVLTALYTRATTGRAHPVEVSLFEALAEWMGPARLTTPATAAASPRAWAPSTPPSPVRRLPGRRRDARCCSPSRTSANGRPCARSSSAGRS
ncbi:hypothetical protein GCM10023238_00460 [Streptomyces heliomycini]